MNSNSIFNLMLIILSLGVLVYFIMQLVQPKSKQEKTEVPRQSAATVNFETPKKKVTFEKTNNNEEVINYEPLVVRQEFPFTPLNMPQNQTQHTHTPVQENMYMQAPQPLQAHMSMQAPQPLQAHMSMQAPQPLQSQMPMQAPQPLQAQMSMQAPMYI